MTLSPLFDSPHCQSFTNALLTPYAATFTQQTADDGPALCGFLPEEVLVRLQFSIQAILPLSFTFGRYNTAPCSRKTHQAYIFSVATGASCAWWSAATSVFNCV